MDTKMQKLKYDPHKGRALAQDFLGTTRQQQTKMVAELLNRPNSPLIEAIRREGFLVAPLAHFKDNPAFK